MTVKPSYSEQLKAFQTSMSVLTKAGSRAMESFGHLHGKALSGGALGKSNQELVAVAFAIASDCSDCVTYHVAAAVRAGATVAEVVEVADIALLMGGGPAVALAAQAVEAAQEFAG